MSQFAEPVIPDEAAKGGRDPWFDRLTTLSKVEGESSESDESRHGPSKEKKFLRSKVHRRFSNFEIRISNF